MESANIKLNERLDLRGDIDKVWSLLTDPYVVVACMPGAEITGGNDDGSLDGVLLTKLGPTSVRFQGTVLPEYSHETRVARLHARGGDERGRTKASATISCQLLSDEETGSTSLNIDADINVTGGLAPFVRTGGVHLTRRMMAEFGANLASCVNNGHLLQKAGVVPSGTPKPQPVNSFRLLIGTLLDVIGDVFRRRTNRKRRVDGAQDGD